MRHIGVGKLLIGVLLVSSCSSGSGTSQQSPSPRAGRTSVALTTSELTSAFGTPSTTALGVTADVLRQRIALVDSDHTATVHIVGDHLEVRASMTVTATLAQLAAGGRLAFRRVVEEMPASPGTVASGGDEYTPAAYQDLSCGGSKVDPAAPDAPIREIVACSKDGMQKFHLGVAEVVGKDIKGANVSTDNNGIQMQVNLQFKGSGQDRWTNLTKAVYGANPPTNQVAILLDGVVYSAPTIQGVIYGDAVITGNFTDAEAESLAAVLRYGALPLSLILR
jgi:preprotein translocase subunit SecD